MKDDSQAKSEKYFSKGIAARDLGRYKIAQWWFIKASKEGVRKERAACWLMVAYCDEELGNLNEALRSLRKAERCNPRLSLIQVQIGLIQLELGRAKLAERALRKAIELKPSAIALIFLASSLARQGRFREQKICYQKALRLEPRNDEAHYNLGICYRDERQYSRAEKHFRYAIEIDPKYAIAYAELGLTLFRKGLYRESRIVLRRSIRLDPDNYWSRLYLAIANWQLRRLKEAEEQYQEALRIEPTEAYGYAVLGDFLSMEQRGDGEKYLKKAMSLNPADELTQYYMGKHLSNEYRDSEATIYLRKSARKGNESAKKLLVKMSSKTS